MDERYPGGLERIERNGVRAVAGGRGRVAFCFTERVGGVSGEPWCSLNLGAHVGDDPAAVRENRRRALALIGADGAMERLIVPNQVHGDHVVVVRSADAGAVAAARAEAEAGADAIVCTAPGVPVLLCFADCVPVVLTAPGGFAVAHSGWKGTIAGIAGTTARALMHETGAAPGELEAFIGPHILGDEYEVSPELMDRFAAQFPGTRVGEGRLLDLSACIVSSLAAAGLAPAQVHDPGLSTLKLRDRFFSYRGEQGRCGRHAAVAYMAP